MVSSGVWAGDIPLDKAHNLQDVDGSRRTLKQELERIGYLGTIHASYRAIPIAVKLFYCFLRNLLILVGPL